MMWVSPDLPFFRDNWPVGAYKTAACRALPPGLGDKAGICDGM